MFPEFLSFFTYGLFLNFYRFPVNLEIFFKHIPLFQNFFPDFYIQFSEIFIFSAFQKWFDILALFFFNFSVIRYFNIFYHFVNVPSLTFSAISEMFRFFKIFAIFVMLPFFQIFHYLINVPLFKNGSLFDDILSFSAIAEMF